MISLNSVCFTHFGVLGPTEDVPRTFGHTDYVQFLDLHQLRPRQANRGSADIAAQGQRDGARMQNEMLTQAQSGGMHVPVPARAWGLGLGWR